MCAHVCVSVFLLVAGFPVSPPAYMSSSVVSAGVRQFVHQVMAPAAPARPTNPGLGTITLTIAVEPLSVGAFTQSFMDHALDEAAMGITRVMVSAAPPFPRRACVTRQRGWRCPHVFT
jgi:hypothetical protein